MLGNTVTEVEMKTYLPGMYLNYDINVVVNFTSWYISVSQTWNLLSHFANKQSLIISMFQLGIMIDTKLICV